MIQSPPPSEVSELEKADIAVGKTLAEKKEHPLVRGVASLGKLGDQGPLYTAAAGVIVFALATRDRRAARAGVSIMAAISAADLLKRIIKRFVYRTRPHILLDEGRYESEVGQSGQKPEQSFPSGHVAGTVAVARAISCCYPRTAGWCFAASVFLGLTRLLKGAHWPLDVAAGGCVGFGAEKLSSWILRWLGVPPRSL